MTRAFSRLVTLFGMKRCPILFDQSSQFVDEMRQIESHLGNQDNAHEHC